MITQTDRFRAAEAGAPVGNMTSAYSGIRWGPGAPRQFQYEQGQSRLGQKLADAPQLYLDNSPVFHLSAVRTPLLILSNDNDDAVPFYQGIELFLGLRRLGKPAWLFNYNGEFSRPAPPRRPKGFLRAHLPVLRPLPQRRPRPPNGWKRASPTSTATPKRIASKKA